MIPRTSPIDLSTPTPIASTSSSIALPGLVSSLRPIKRAVAQLEQEASLLRRFCYKNKNQHKANGWWKRIVHVDRLSSRVVDELRQLFAALRVDIDADDFGSLNEASLLVVWARLPRASLIVDKFLSVILASSATLEQLVHSRAFMAFSLVLTSLHARLYALSNALNDDLVRAILVVAKLVRAESLLLDQAEKMYRRCPKELRKFLPDPGSKVPLSVRPSADHSRAATPTSTTTMEAKDLRVEEMGSNDDVGMVVSREEMLALAKARSAPSTKTHTGEAPIEDQDMHQQERRMDVSPREENGQKIYQNGGEVQELQKKRRKERTGEDAGKAKKKKKKPRDGADEIDDIFG